MLPEESWNHVIDTDENGRSVWKLDPEYADYVGTTTNQTPIHAFCRHQFITTTTNTTDIVLNPSGSIVEEEKPAERKLVRNRKVRVITPKE